MKLGVLLWFNYIFTLLEIVCISIFNRDVIINMDISQSS